MKNYYIATIEENNGEYEYEHKFLIAAENDEEADKHLLYLCKNWYGSHEEDGEEGEVEAKNDEEVEFFPLSLNGGDVVITGAYLKSVSEVTFYELKAKSILFQH